MERDSIKMRGDRPFMFTNLKTGEGLAEVVNFVSSHVLAGKS
jgi:urease accessory protein